MKNNVKSFGDHYEITVNHAVAHVMTLSVKGIMIRDILANREIARIRTKGKQALISIANLLHPRFADNCLLVLGKDSTKVCVNNLSNDESPFEIFDISTLPNHGTKHARVSLVKVHMLDPYKVVLVTTEGLAVFNIDINWSPNFGIVPSSGDKLSKLYYGVGGAIYVMDSLSPDDEEFKATVHDPIYKVTTSFPNDTLLLDFSPSKIYISVYWPNAGKFQVLSSKTWKVVEEGPTTSALAWSSSCDRYAIISPTKHVCE